MKKTAPPEDLSALINSFGQEEDTPPPRATGPQRKRPRLVLYIDADDKKKLKVLAIEQNTSSTAIVEQLIKAHLREKS